MSKQQWIAENLKPGEVYAGIILGKNGDPDHHLVLLPGALHDVNWTDATRWAESIGGELPTRREQALLFANTKELADTQAAKVQTTLIQELMTMSKNVTVEGARAAFSDQRVEIVLLNR